jgi:hypothetical protein
MQKTLLELIEKRSEISPEKWRSSLLATLYRLHQRTAVHSPPRRIENSAATLDRDVIPWLRMSAITDKVPCGLVRWARTRCKMTRTGDRESTAAGGEATVSFQVWLPYCSCFPPKLFRPPGPAGWRQRRSGPETGRMFGVGPGGASPWVR